MVEHAGFIKSVTTAHSSEIILDVNPGKEKAMTYYKPNTVTICLLFLLMIAQPLVAQTLESFSATAENNAVRLEWRTINESGVTGFCVLRSIDGRHFYKICNIDPVRAGHTYHYVDNDLFKENNRTFYYRLEICMSGGRKVYSQTKEVTLSFSGVQRTWGSIKAMFR